MYPAARAYRQEVFQYFFKSVVEASPDVLVNNERRYGENKRTIKIWNNSVLAGVPGLIIAK
jgi:hypothetical protein